MHIYGLIFFLFLSSCVPVHRQIEWTTDQVTDRTERGMEIIGSKNWRAYKFYETHEQQHRKREEKEDEKTNTKLFHEVPQEAEPSEEDPDDFTLDEAIHDARAILFYPWENTIVDLSR